MTEQDWFQCTDPEPMMELLRGKASERKLRLFDIACCRKFEPYYKRVGLLLAPQTIEMGERLADGVATKDDLDKALDALHDSQYNSEGVPRIPLHAHTDLAIYQVVTTNPGRVGTVWWDLNACPSWEVFPSENEEGGDYQAILASRSRMLRCIFGPLPFRRITFSSNWLTSRVKQLVVAIYEQRAFDRLPILADALEQAGCHNPDILAHCHQPGEHVRGCWIVDLILGKQ